MKKVHILKKKWLLGPWNSGSPLEVGHIDENNFKKIKTFYYHEKTFEYFLVCNGNAKLRIGSRIIEIKAGDVLMIEPGEKHGLVDISSDFECFVIKYPSDSKDNKL